MHREFHKILKSCNRKNKCAKLYTLHTEYIFKLIEESILRIIWIIDDSDKQTFIFAKKKYWKFWSQL